MLSVFTFRTKNFSTSDNNQRVLKAMPSRNARMISSCVLVSDGLYSLARSVRSSIEVSITTSNHVHVHRVVKKHFIFQHILPQSASIPKGMSLATFLSGIG